MIHPTAIIDPSATIDATAEIGPYSIIGPEVVIGARTKFQGHAFVDGPTEIGEDNTFFPYSTVGVAPQDLKYRGERAFTRIGNRNTIREFVSIHRGTVGGGLYTTIGDDCLLMTYSHIAHDCTIGNHVIVGNSVGLSGHVTVEDWADIAPYSGVHQFCRIGRLAMIGGCARIIRDVPPFTMIDGDTAMIVGLNKVGLRRAGFTLTEMTQLKQAYRVIYRNGLMWKEMLEALRLEFSSGPASEFMPFFLGGKRGFVQERRTPPGAIVRLVRDDAEDADFRSEAPAVPLLEAEKKVG